MKDKVHARCPLCHGEARGEGRTTITHHTRCPEHRDNRYAVPPHHMSKVYAAAKCVSSEDIHTRRDGWNDLDAVLDQVAAEAYDCGVVIGELWAGEERDQ